MKKTVVLVLLSITLTILGCSKSNAEDKIDTFSATECVNLIKKISERERNENCSEIRADIEKIEKKCGKFLDDEQRKSLASAKKLCEDN